MANLNPEEMNQYEISLKRRLDTLGIEFTHERLKNELEEFKIILAENDRLIAENERLIAEKDRLIAEKDHRFIGYLKNQGHTIEQIIEITNLDIEVTKKIYYKV
ncbi:hypothetical protein ACYSNX_02575 [Myroides sp. LJL115]